MVFLFTYNVIYTNIRVGIDEENIIKKLIIRYFLQKFALIFLIMLVFLTSC